ncbi:MAG: EAL domain-containing protein [Marinobacter sp.]|uniref:EAL domain-containing protein n=1 Tax=Marinobacter sp. TaxID=50741 RepID=UPI00396D3CC1
MDSQVQSHANPQAPSAALRYPATWPKRWLPLMMLVASVIYGLTASLWLGTGSGVHELSGIQKTSGDTLVSISPQWAYRIQSLATILASRSWTEPEGWIRVDPEKSGVGYPYQPVTYRLQLENSSDTSAQRKLIVPAPYLDHLAPALVHPDGRTEHLAILGDRYPFNRRYVALPQWIWPITLQPGRTTVLMEVQNNGPVLLPVSLATADESGSQGAANLVLKAFITGLLVFALLLNLSIVVRLRRPGLAWLSVLMVAVIHSQLVMDGLGFWLIWPYHPELNALLGITLPLCLIALCEFTPHFLSIGRSSTRLLHAFSLLGSLHLLAAPFAIKLMGQDSFLVTSVLGGAFICALAFWHRHHAYGRYFAMSILIILLGATITSLRTIGWLPVNTVTDSAFFLGAALGSLILTSGVGRLLVQERKRRMGSDIRVRQERQLRTRIEQEYDQLMRTHRVTGKPNRPVLEEALETINSSQSPYTLCIVRLARFNELEQALGYHTAEDLLKQYLRQLNSVLKRCLDGRLITIDGQGLATLDTSNHAFAFYRDPDAGQEDPALGAITRWFGENFREGRFSFSWAPKLGLAHAPEHGRDATTILSSAGFASLDDSRPLSVYDPSIARRLYRQQMLILDVEEALKAGEMWLEYQPKVNIRDGRIDSLEGLIRWHHGEFGRVPPDQWIPLAEEVGIIHTVTLWVLDRACQDFAALCDQFGQDISVSVNISAKDLAQPGFHRVAARITRRHGLSPENIILEITETAMMSDPAIARKTISLLSGMGFRIALDDFGTGHSSLGTLATFDLDELKIDRSFLKNIMCYPKRQRILRVALELGESLDLDVVVEGVEDEAIAIWLQQFPGLHGQGYYWGPPVLPREH